MIVAILPDINRISPEKYAPAKRQRQDKRSQLPNTCEKELENVSGTIGAPATFARDTTPLFALIRGPFGPSGVMPTTSPSSSRANWMNAQHRLLSRIQIWFSNRNATSYRIPVGRPDGRKSAYERDRTVARKTPSPIKRPCQNATTKVHLSRASRRYCFHRQFATDPIG